MREGRRRGTTAAGGPVFLLPSSLIPHPSSLGRGGRMRLYVDLRSLQDPRYAFRGIGHVGSSVLRHVRRFLPEVEEIVGLREEHLPDLPESYRPLVDRTQWGFLPTGGRTQPALFYQPSPMTHDPG